MSGIIDEQGYRLNVGIVLMSPDGKVFWGRRVGNRDAWQFPQGGMMPGETPEQTLYRELHEEVGLHQQDVEVVACTEGWLSYRLPRRFLRNKRYPSQPSCIGQRQKWFLLKLTSDEAAINLAASETPEFNSWRWVSYWYPVRKVVQFKRGVYVRALRELAPAMRRLRRENERA